MDYTEGLLLGKLWSDTDFENRRHATLFILYGLLVDAVIFLTHFMETPLLGLGSVNMFEIVLLILLTLACPFICFKYYRMPLWGKIIVLIEKLYKHFVVMDITVYLMTSKITVGKSNLQDFLIDYLNSTLEKYTEKYQADAGAFSTVMGVLSGGIHIMFVVALIAFCAVVIPGVIFLAYRCVQFAYDWVIEHLVLRKVFHYRK